MIRICNVCVRLPPQTYIINYEKMYFCVQSQTNSSSLSLMLIDSGFQLFNNHSYTSTKHLIISYLYLSIYCSTHRHALLLGEVADLRLVPPPLLAGHHPTHQPRQDSPSHLLGLKIYLLLLDIFILLF